MNPKALTAELFGTFGLTLAVLISINTQGFPVPTPVIAGLTLGLFVYTIGSVSGCHINPAVTVGLFSIGKIEPLEAATYIVAQFAGAGIALLAGNALFDTLAPVTASGAISPGIGEMVGAVFFLFGISAVVLGRVPTALSGGVIGGSLLLGESMAAHASNGVLNPAVALGIGSFSLPYIWGPVVGAILGALLSRSLSESF